MTHKKKKQNQPTLLPLKLSYSTLVEMAQLALSRHPIVNIEVLTMAQTLFTSLDKSLFAKDQKSLAILEFILLALTARIEKRLEKQSLIIQYCLDNNVKYKDEYDELIVILKNEPLTPREVDYVINSISEYLSLAVIISNKDILQGTLDKFNSKEFDSTGQMITEFYDVCGAILKDIRDSKIEKVDTTLDTTKSDCRTKIKATIQKLKKQGNRLNTGIIGLNQMTNGGLENTRIYTIAAPPSGGKSLFALNLALTLKKYNEGPHMVQPNGAIPLILFITHENTVPETIERLYGVTVSGTPLYSSNEDEDMIADKIAEVIEHDPDVEGSIGIHFHYMPSNQCNVQDIANYIEQLEDKGYKVITLLHDYIKKIRPNYVRNDMRLDLAQVVDDFKSMALLKNIPILLLTQISRAGFAGMEEALRKNNPDALKDSSRTIIGESWGIVENSDWVSIVLRVPDIVNGETVGHHMSFLNTKARNGNQGNHFFFQPFDNDTPLKLLPDYGTKPLGKNSLLVTFEDLEKITNEEIEKGKAEIKELLNESKVMKNKKKKSEEANSLEGILGL